MNQIENFVVDLLLSFYFIHKILHKDLTYLTENYRPIKYLTFNEEDS